MKSIGIIVMFILLTTSTLALIDEDYILVVAEDGPASDVVEAANFAAWIKQKEPVPGVPYNIGGVTFTSATDQQVYAQFNNEDLRERLLVVVNGEKNVILIIAGEYAATEKIQIASSATHYFTEKGYLVFAGLNGVEGVSSHIWMEEAPNDRPTFVNLDDGSYPYDGFKFEKDHTLSIKDIFLGEEPELIEELKKTIPEVYEAPEEMVEETKIIPEVIKEETTVDDDLVEGSVVEPQNTNQNLLDETVEENTGEQEGLFSRIISWLKNLF